MRPDTPSTTLMLCTRLLNGSTYLARTANHIATLTGPFLFHAALCATWKAGTHRSIRTKTLLKPSPYGLLLAHAGDRNIKDGPHWRSCATLTAPSESLAASTLCARADAPTLPWKKWTPR